MMKTTTTTTTTTIWSKPCLHSSIHTHTIPSGDQHLWVALIHVILHKYYEIALNALQKPPRPRSVLTHGYSLSWLTATFFGSQPLRTSKLLGIRRAKTKISCFDAFDIMWFIIWPMTWPTWSTETATCHCLWSSNPWRSFASAQHTIASAKRSPWSRPVEVVGLDWHTSPQLEHQVALDCLAYLKPTGLCPVTLRLGRHTRPYTVPAATNRPISQIPLCTCPISHNVPLSWMVHCGIWNRPIVGFMN